MPAMRAQASAIYIGVITIVASLGPVIVSQPPPLPSTLSPLSSETLSLSLSLLSLFKHSPHPLLVFFITLF